MHTIQAVKQVNTCFTNNFAVTIDNIEKNNEMDELIKSGTLKCKSVHFVEIMFM